MLFSRPLNSWDDWSAVFCRADEFTPLVRAILASCGRPAQDPVCLTPGTNAVFAVGDAVIKLFVPAENASEAAFAENLKVYPVDDLAQLVRLRQ